MEFFHKLLHLFKNLGDDAAWQSMIHFIGQPTLYGLMFAIIFAETGLVILPFLPGDSLLFALGAMGARDIGINLWLMTGLLIVAAVIGDAVNYWVGYKLGPAVFKEEDPEWDNAPAADGVQYERPKKPRTLKSRLLNRNHLLKAQSFYEKYGAKTIILARFVPIVRTFAPFVAGIGKMSYPRFFLYNVVGGIAWVLICVVAGRLFGQIEFVKKRFELVILAIIAISVLPMAIEFIKARREGKAVAEAAEDAVGIK